MFREWIFAHLEARLGCVIILVLSYLDISFVISATKSLVREDSTAADVGLGEAIRSAPTEATYRAIRESSVDPEQPEVRSNLLSSGSVIGDATTTAPQMNLNIININKVDNVGDIAGCIVNGEQTENSKNKTTIVNVSGASRN